MYIYMKRVEGSFLKKHLFVNDVDCLKFLSKKFAVKMFPNNAENKFFMSFCYSSMSWAASSNSAFKAEIRLNFIHLKKLHLKSNKHLYTTNYSSTFAVLMTPLRHI